jgi:hypothetical protein
MERVIFFYFFYFFGGLGRSGEVYNRNPMKIMCTTLLNDGIFRVHRFSVVTPARLHRSDFIFRFYIYGGTFDSPPGYLLSAREQFLALYALMGFWICWDY